MYATLQRTQSEADIFRYVVSDAELEAAAEATALSYTYDTSRYNRCCD
jgi:hypothetical protein